MPFPSLKIMGTCVKVEALLLTNQLRTEPPWQGSMTKNEIFAVLCHEGLGLSITMAKY